MNAVVEITAGEARLAAKSDQQRSAAAGLVLEAASSTANAPVPRLATGFGEFDRVLGGGLPPAATILLGGEPGIGKSTLLAQATGLIGSQHPALYVTAEESVDQVRRRLERCGVVGVHLELSGSNDAAAIAGAIRAGKHRLVVVDSVQLISLSTIEGEPGGPSQVRAAAATLVEAAKASGTALVLVGHVTKDGGLAGPRLLEHLVDCVLAFEGDRYADLRTLRAVKNRFGSTSEIGLFRMGSQGLEEVADPAGMFIADRDAAAPGTCVVPVVEGNRCMLVEVQALVNPTQAPQPQRRVSGLDTNRAAMVLAVLARRLRFSLANCDVFLNVTGGVRVAEPAADLGIALAVASALREIAVPADLVAVGEVGLAGELRPVPRYELRAAEARRLGFKRLIGPGAGQGRGRVVCARLDEAVTQALGG